MLGTDVTLTGYYADGDSGPDRRYKLTNVNPGSVDDGAIVVSNAPGYWWVWQNVPYEIDVRAYGAVLDDSSDGFSAFKKALAYINSRGGGALFVPGKLAIASSSWAANGSIITTAQGRAVIRGIGNKNSHIRIIGTSSLADVLIYENAKNITFEEIAIIGNGPHGGGGFGRFIAFHLTSGALDHMENFYFNDVRFQDIGADNWLRFYADGQYTIRQIGFNNCQFVSATGDSYDPATIGEASTMISLGEGTAKPARYVVEEVTIENCWAEGTYVKRFLDCWSGVRRVTVRNTTLLNFGRTGAQNNKGGYALMAYDDSTTTGYPPEELLYDRVRIESARSCGLYAVGGAAGSVQATVRNCEIGNVKDPNDSSLGKGAVVLSIAAYGEVSGCKLTDNFAGVSSVGGDGKTTVIAKNVIKTNVGDSYGIVIRGAAGLEKRARHIIEDNDIDNAGAAGRAIFLQSSSAASAHIGEVDIRGGRLAGARAAIEGYDGAGECIFTGVSIRDVHIAGALSNAGIAFVDASNPISIRNVDIDLSGSTAGSAVNLAGCTKVDIDGLVIRNRTMGGAKCLSLTGARGSMRNVKFENVDPSLAVASNDFGVIRPTWPAPKGTFIQNLLAAKTEHAGSIPAVTGWENVDGARTWQETRI